MKHVNPNDDSLRDLLQSAYTIAVVGASGNPDRPSHEITKILIHARFHVIPITPNESAVLGRRAYPSLAEVPNRIDIVDVFRRADAAPAIAEEAARIGARALWLQLETVKRLGIRSNATPPDDAVTEAGKESFPARDPPAWTAGLARLIPQKL